MTFRSQELARHAQEEMLEGEARDLERRLQALEGERADLAAELDRRRADARAALHHAPGNERWLGLAWLLFINGSMFASGLSEPPLRWVLFGVVIAALIGFWGYAYRKLGNDKARKAADEALQEQLVAIAKVRVSVPPEELALADNAERPPESARSVDG